MNPFQRKVEENQWKNVNNLNKQGTIANQLSAVCTLTSLPAIYLAHSSPALLCPVLSIHRLPHSTIIHLVNCLFVCLFCCLAFIAYKCYAVDVFLCVLVHFIIDHIEVWWKNSAFHVHVVPKSFVEMAQFTRMNCRPYQLITSERNEKLPPTSQLSGAIHGETLLQFYCTPKERII